MSTNYLPGRYKIPEAVTGDTFAGIPELSIKVNGSAPTNSLSSVSMKFATSHTAAAASLELTSGAGDITINNALTWNITVEPFTVSLADGTYIYDMEFTDSAGNVKTYVAGTWTISEDVPEA